MYLEVKWSEGSEIIRYYNEKVISFKSADKGQPPPLSLPVSMLNQNDLKLQELIINWSFVKHTLIL